MRGEMKGCVAMSLLASPSLTSRTTSRSVGVSDSQRAARAFAFAAATVCVGDRLFEHRTNSPWGELRCSPSPAVGMGAVIDAADVEHSVILEQPEGDAVVAAARDTPSFEFQAQGFEHPIWVGRQCGGDEFGDGGGNFVR